MLLLAAFSWFNVSSIAQNKLTLFENNLHTWVRLDSNKNFNLPERMKETGVNGLTIAVIDNYRIAWVKSYGMADTAEKRRVSNHTLFQSASIGKSVHGLAIMKLVQQNRLDLTADINQYLRRMRYTGPKITLAQILSHTAGLSVHGFDGYKTGDTIPTLLRIIAGQPPANNAVVTNMLTPSTRFQYSGGGYELSELLLEDVTKENYATFMERNIFRPLNMSTASYRLQPHNAATAYRSDKQPIGCKYHLYPEKACGAGLWTTATDLAKFVIEIQLSLAGKSNKLLSTQLTRQMLQPYAPAKNYAMGFFIDQKGGETYFQHSGLNEGFSSQYYGSMKGGKGVVVLTNSDDSRLIEEIVNSVAYVYKWKDFSSGFVTKKVITPPTAVMDSIVGHYTFANSNGPTITRENDRMYLKDPNSAHRWRMFFTSNTDFFMLEAKWANQQLFFDEKGRVAGIYILGNNYKEAMYRKRID